MSWNIKVSHYLRQSVKFMDILETAIIWFEIRVKDYIYVYRPPFLNITFKRYTITLHPNLSPILIPSNMFMSLVSCFPLEYIRKKNMEQTEHALYSMTFSQKFVIITSACNKINILPHNVVHCRSPKISTIHPDVLIHCYPSLSTAI